MGITASCCIPAPTGQITPADAERVLEGFGAGDLLMLQNEISSLDEIIEKAYRRGLRIALNPSPVDDALLHSAALPLVDWLILNEIEGGSSPARRSRSASATRCCTGSRRRRWC